MIKFVLFSLIHFVINNFFLKINFLIDKKKTSFHKKKVFTNIKTPLSGGIIFIIFFPFIQTEQNFILLFTLLALYVIGFLSDINFLTSPIKRIILQTSLILIFIIIYDLSIKTLSLEILDKILNIKTFNVFFLLICLLVLINGFNFLDGINTLVVGNFLICLISIYYISSKYQLSLDLNFIENILILLSVIFIFNFFGKSFLGDSGTYTIGFIIGIIFVNFAYENFFRMSPYFIACILWYPAIENLFSILRRIFFKKKISKADNNHLHHLIYLFNKKKKLTKSNLFLNTLTGIMINIYLFLSSLVATFYYDHTKTLLIIILFNILLYLGLYNYLFKLIKNK
tara:strand:- start:929 stop:1951 length:1023 start_codon:yes stop_codon:yes gene_type:complete